MDLASSSVRLSFEKQERKKKDMDGLTVLAYPVCKTSAFPLTK